MKTQLAALAGLSLAVLCANAPAAKDKTARCLADVAKLAGPATLPMPTKPHTVPLPAQPKPQTPTPTPRRAPKPDRPMTPKPTVDPKDIIDPADLYKKDPGMEKHWESLPETLRNKMVEAARTERQEIDRKLAAKGVTNANFIPKLLELLQGLPRTEAPHKQKIEKIVQEMMASAFDEDTASKVKLKLGSDLPDRRDTNEAPPAEGGGGWLNNLKDKFKGGKKEEGPAPLTAKELNFYIYRRELYNSLSQASGWNGMESFIRLSRDELNALSPGLAEKYELLHLLFRKANYATLDSVNTTATIRQADRDSMSHGREIVEATYTEGEDEHGGKYIEPKDVKAQAVGKNGWALAHEGMKAGFEVKTILEGTQRSVLTPQEQAQVDYLTNSNVAEIRQGIFGTTFDLGLRQGLRTVVNGPKGLMLTPEQYFTMVERIFSSLPEAKFRETIDTLFSPDFATNTASQKRLQAMFREFAILDGINPTEE